MEIEMDESVKIGVRENADGSITGLADWCSGEMTVYALDRKELVAQMLSDVAAYFGYDSVIDLCENS